MCRRPVARRAGFAVRATKKAIEKGEQETINFEPFDEVCGHFEVSALFSSSSPRTQSRTMVQVTTELANVESADMSVGSDNFARVDYHRECEYAVNEQIK